MSIRVVGVSVVDYESENFSSFTGITNALDDL